MTNNFFTPLSKETLLMILSKVEEFNGDGICICMEINDKGYDGNLKCESMRINVTIPKKFSKTVLTL
jgi:hypothetical protein